MEGTELREQLLKPQTPKRALVWKESNTLLATLTVNSIGKEKYIEVNLVH